MIPHNHCYLDDNVRRAVDRVVRSGYVGPGREVEALECELIERFRPGHEVVCVSSGTAALSVALRAMGWDVRDLEDPEFARTTAIPTYSCGALYNAARAVGKVSVYDERPDADSNDACVVTHDYGVPSTRLSGRSDDSDGLFPKWIEDFTHAPGVTGCGNLGDAAVISFGATKPLGAGAGGAILAEEKIARSARSMLVNDQVDRGGDTFNWSMSDVHAAIVRERLRRLDEDNAWRATTAAAYLDALGLDWPVTTRGWYRFAYEVRDPTIAIAYLKGLGVEAINPLRPDELLHRQLGLDPEGFPNAERLAAHTISLPIWPGMTDVQVDDVCSALKMGRGHGYLAPYWD